MPVAIIWLLFAIELLLLLALHLPGIADFEKFAFYDQGAWLRLDQLVAGGAKPTVNIGYSYGMLPLILGRGWFILLGRTPWAFIAFVTTCNMIAAWGMARIIQAVGAARWRVAFGCLLLPYAIFPSNYSLMHALEMMLLVLALAQLARGRCGGALAFATLALFTKPTMAYILGLLLLLLAGWLKKGFRVVIAPVLAAVACILLELFTLGSTPLLNNLLPLTGGRSYRAMNFGIFRAGTDFWWHREANPLATALYYLFTPVTFWLIASFLLWLLAAGAIARLVRKRACAPRDPLLATTGILHAFFVFAFFAWSGSWTYYSYLLVIGLLTALPAVPWPRVLRAGAAALAWIALCGLFSDIGDGIGRWRGMQRSADAGGLWVYPDLLAEAQKLRATAGPHAYFLVNGELPLFWPDARTPAVWFLSPGIPTPTEIQHIRNDLAASDEVILYRSYSRNQEAWNWPEFSREHSTFSPEWEGRYFRVFKRRSN